MDAYALLATELERWRSLPRHQVAARLGAPPIVSSAMIGDETISIEVKVRWDDAGKRRLRVEGTAYGSSVWKLERFEERIVLDVMGTTG